MFKTSGMYLTAMCHMVFEQTEMIVLFKLSIAARMQRTTEFMFQLFLCTNNNIYVYIVCAAYYLFKHLTN